MNAWGDLCPIWHWLEAISHVMAEMRGKQLRKLTKSNTSERLALFSHAGPVSDKELCCRTQSACLFHYCLSLLQQAVGGYLASAALLHRSTNSVTTSCRKSVRGTQRSLSQLLPAPPSRTARAAPSISHQLHLNRVTIDHAADIKRRFDWKYLFKSVAWHDLV